jgi:hypothetical protein
VTPERIAHMINPTEEPTYCQTVTVVTIDGEEREEVCGGELLASEHNVCRSCEVCRHCEQGLGDRLYFSSFNIFDEPFCSNDCVESYETSEAENAHERFLSAYYGGEVATMEEQYREAFEEKRRLS